MLMAAWMGRWAQIKGMQDPGGTGRRMMRGEVQNWRQGSENEKESLENFYRHTHVLPVSQGAEVKSRKLSGILKWKL